MRQISPTRGAFFIYFPDSDYLKPQIEQLHALQSDPLLHIEEKASPTRSI
jgi:hypothetical protein